MKNTALTVLKKELARFFGDRRLVFSSIILPGLLIFVMYSLMGTAMKSFLSVDDTYVYTVEAVNMPQSVGNLFPSDEYKVTSVGSGDIEESKKKLANEEIDLCIVFPEDFDSIISNYLPNGSNESVPNIEMYYNSTKISSTTAYDVFASRLNAMENSISNVFDINYVSDESEVNKYDVATREETTGMMFASILPMLIIILLYSGCVALAPESIAGEKERGTIATLLVTPAPRNQIVIGKISALAIIALLSGLSSFLGTFLSMPSLMSMDEIGVDMSSQVYVLSDYLWLILLILSTVLVFITVISIISAAAKTVKEAATLVTPLMVVVMLVSFASMYGTTAKTEVTWYLIPVYNTLQSMIGVFSFTASTLNIVVTVVSNVVYSLIGVVILTKMFNNEKIVFSK